MRKLRLRERQQLAWHFIACKWQSLFYWAWMALLLPGPERYLDAVKHTWPQILRIWPGFASRCVFCAHHGLGVLVWHLELLTNWPCGTDSQGMRVEMESQRMALTG